jgi:hypothetical protein
MMNEGSIPTPYLEALVVGCLDMITKRHPNITIPTIAIAGGFANETQMFKALAMGAPYIKCIAMARAPLTAAMKAQYVGNAIDNNEVSPAMLRSLGFPKTKDPLTLTLSEAFVEYEKLKTISDKEDISPSAVGVFTYFASKLGTGLKQLLAGVRKFNLELITRDDIAYLSQRAGEVCKKWNLGIHSQESVDFEAVKNEIYSGKYI